MRDVLDLAEAANKQGWALHSLAERLDTSTPTGRFTLTLLSALAALEREQVGERVRVALDELRRQGRRVSGRPPFGFRFTRDGRVVPVPSEQKLLKRVRRLQREGMGSWRIWQRLCARGDVNPRSGRPWSRGTVIAILRTAGGSSRALVGLRCSREALRSH